MNVPIRLLARLVKSAWFRNRRSRIITVLGVVVCLYQGIRFFLVQEFLVGGLFLLIAGVWYFGNRWSERKSRS